MPRHHRPCFTDPDASLRYPTFLVHLRHQVGRRRKGPATTVHLTRSPKGDATQCSALSAFLVRHVKPSHLLVLFSSLPHLTELEFSDSTGVNTATLNALCESATKLQTLDIHSCPGVNDQGLREIARMSRTLLNLSRVVQVPCLVSK